MKKPLLITALLAIQIALAIGRRSAPRQTAQAVLPDFVPAPAPVLPQVDPSAIPQRRRSPAPPSTSRLARVPKPGPPLRMTDGERLRAMRLTAPPSPGKVLLQQGNYALV